MKSVVPPVLMALSEVVGSAIDERQGERIARVKDVVARLREGTYPRVSGLVSRAGGRDFYIPIERVAEIGPRRVRLVSGTVDAGRFQRRLAGFGPLVSLAFRCVY